ncbi:hypothetical protein [Actinomarinicola tropica]|uniref:Uncharacterized protein n=1 Tax=Actinomarinicola tropica TaxID=2789776 RepID=A0A5Q2RCY3_9ACTN|nr:hypothetical protein [Actinomarinicola tropica]QGG94749.1 hypothetical protein GH723_06285 [Actinomarinicola tropica]
MAPSAPVPGWWQRTWPLVALGTLSIAMWIGRIRNVVGDDALSGFGRSFRLGLALSFVLMGVALLTACWSGRRNRNWREAAHRADDGWRAGAGVPEWGRTVATLLVAWTTVVWLVQGIGILVDPHHDAGFKVVHTVLMLGSLVVAGFGAWGLRRSWPVAPPSRPAMSG